MLTKLARIGSIVASMVLASTAFTLAATSATPATTTVAQASPAPKASSNPFTWSARVRAYYFTRQNAYSGDNGALGGPNSKPNQASFLPSIALHGDYVFQDSGFGVGATYFYANPLNNCSSPSSHFPENNTNTCTGAGFSAAPGNNNVYQDDTLPGFEMSTLYEAYADYKGNGLSVKAGDQVTPSTLVWVPQSDTRNKPAAFQGVDASYALNSNWSVEAADFWQWECRTCSNFDHYNLYTNPTIYPYAGGTAFPTYYYNPAQDGVPNNGVIIGRVGYKGSDSLPLTANLSYYAFDKIANLVWLDAMMPFKGTLKPFVQAQFGSESNSNNYSLNGVNTGILGDISSTVWGLKGGVNVLPNVQLTAGFDSMPWKSTTLSAAQVAGVITCSNTSHYVSLPKGVKPNTVNLPYFLPISGTGECTANSDGSITLYYGGLASPYTFGYTSDPLFTTQMTQGMIERQSPGTSYKVQLTFTSDNKQLVTYINEGWFNYNNGAYAQGTNEVDFDTWYYFSKIPKSGPYHGFSFRYRYGDRDESTWVGSKAAGLFKYNRFQAQYDF